MGFVCKAAMLASLLLPTWGNIALEATEPKVHSGINGGVFDPAEPGTECTVGSAETGRAEKELTVQTEHAQFPHKVSIFPL